MTARLTLRVPAGASVRADRFLAEHLEGLSRRRVQEMLERGLIRVDGRRLRKGDALPPGGEIAVEIAPPAVTDLEPEPDPPLVVLHEDSDVVALDKPAGRPAHALRPEDRGTVANFLAARYPESRDASEDPLEHGLVHRLDTGTSGVLLVARKREGWSELRRQFQAREIDKRYLALARGAIAAPGEIALAIEPHPDSRRRVKVVAPGRTSARSRPAVTRYRPLARYGDATLVEVEIPTGVMHQIRAHLAFLGHPIAGDALYGSKLAAPAPRLMLHAAAIGFRHPRSGERVRIESPMPADFLEELRAK
ncbi:MAG: RluA family pseudouridine synthase [Candidatus Binatia bacterium]